MSEEPTLMSEKIEELYLQLADILRNHNGKLTAWEMNLLQNFVTMYWADYKMELKRED